MEKNVQLLTRARELRRDMTEQERKLWYVFLRTYPVKFYRQKIIESFIVDFYCPAAKLVIEVDGSQHYTNEGLQCDEERSAFLHGHGLRIFRFSNREVEDAFCGVCDRIHQVVQNRCGVK